MGADKSKSPYETLVSGAFVRSNIKCRDRQPAFALNQQPKNPAHQAL